MSKPVYVDIDGTMTMECEGFGEKIYRSRTPRQDIIDAVNKLYDDGKFIVVWTSRFEEDRKVTMRWLKENRIKYHKLVMDKPQYDLLIDDKAISPKNFSIIMKGLSSDNESFSG